MGISHSFPISFAKSQLASKNPIPQSGNVFLSLNDLDKPHSLQIARDFLELGFKLFATKRS
jgi:carbamoyl-phosphate synthase large subunit